MRKSKELAIKALELIGGAALDTATLIEALLSSPYGASYSRLQKSIREIERRRGEELNESRRNRQFYDLLFRLKRDGLIEQRTDAKKKWWIITAKGKDRLLIWRNKQKYSLPPVDYDRAESKELKIITFDVPERYKRKRAWLREALRFLGFTMLQKSVWVGKRALPEEFLKDLQDLGLVSYVEIFVVTKAGSLKHMV